MKTKSIKAPSALPSVRSSNWARRFKRAVGGSAYEEGIRIATRLRLGEISGVTIEKTDAYHGVPCGIGDYRWVICPFVVYGPDWQYWLDIAPTKKRAVEICKEMGWKVLK
jgi:hypothetical protein